MFSVALRELRKQKKLSQSALAEIVGMSQATVASWENGTRKPDVETVSYLADYFGVTVDYLMGRDEPTQEERAEVPPHLMESYELLRQLTPEEFADIAELARFKLYQRQNTKK